MELKQLKTNSFSTKIIGVDLFAGVGGMSMGARNSGIDVQVVVEADQWAAVTYMANHSPKHKIFAGDIRKFIPEAYKLEKNLPMVVFGGPPCQGFSTSNQKTRNSENKTNWLFEEFIRVVRYYKPDWVVFENVKGILETEGGIFVDRIITTLRKLGYTVEYEILKASKFGVPQNRSRFFMVASLHGINFKFPKPNYIKEITVKQALSDLPILTNGARVCQLNYSKKTTSGYAKQMRNKNNLVSNNLVTNNNSLIIERYQHIPQGGNWENIPDHLMTNYTNKLRCHTGIYKRLEENKPSVVIGNFRKNMLIHPTQNRGLSVREAARLQSFPDNFIFKGSIGFQQQQVGNAVPPLLAETIFNALVKQTK